MIVLLPPSETKHQPTRGKALDLAGLSFPALGPTRAAVLAELADLSGQPSALEVLGVSAGLADQVARNQRLATAPTATAGAIYTGVLYDALDLASMDISARRRAARRLVVVSALFGALRITDRIPAYRLSMGVTLPAQAITAVHRSDDSGTTENFTDYLFQAAPSVWTEEADGEWPAAFGGESAQGTAGVVDAVTGGTNTIGYAAEYRLHTPHKPFQDTGQRTVTDVTISYLESSVTCTTYR